MFLVVEREKQECGDVQGTGAGDLRCGSRVWGEGRLLLSRPGGGGGGGGGRG